jgi:hypothetical protein
MRATSSNITALPTRKRSRARPAQAKSISHQQYAAAGVAAVAVVLTALSLSHLAAGIALVTKAPVAEAWAMAVGIDLGFIALEAAQLAAATAAMRRAICRYTVPAILGTLAASGALNALAFAAQADGLLLYPAAALGIAIPGLIYALSRTAFAMASK